MVRKLLALVLVLVFGVSLVPKDAFADDHCQESGGKHKQHCCVSCPVCFHAIAPASVSSEQPAFPVIFELAQEFSYQNPSLGLLKRPPISLA